MFTPPVGGQNCVLQKDRFGCCDTGYKCFFTLLCPISNLFLFTHILPRYKCETVAHPPAPSLGGGGGVLGGYRREALSAETKKVPVLRKQGVKVSFIPPRWRLMR